MSDKRLQKNQGWADLHEDMLLLVKEKLEAVDQFRFRAVCRNWRSLSHVRSADKLPWVVQFRCFWETRNDKHLGYILYDPSNNKEYLSDGNKLSCSAESIIVYGSKYGWVFLAVLPSNKLYLYHAFTMKTIDLPAMKVRLRDSKGTFSTSTPTCSDCVFCVITNEGVRADYKIRLYTCRTGDETWIKFNLEIPGCKRLVDYDVIYKKGLIYCVSRKGLLWAFNIASSDYQQVRIDMSEITNTLSKIERGLWYQEKMIESNGELLLVYYCKYWKPWYIFKLDWSLMAWVKEVTLGNRALFLGATSISVPTDREIISLAGRIYFLRDLRFGYYDFENNAGHQSSKIEPLICKYYSLEKNLFLKDWVWVEPYL